MTKPPFKLMNPKKAAHYVASALYLLEDLKHPDRITVLTVALHIALKDAIHDRARVRRLIDQLHEATLQTMDNMANDSSETLQ
jgi:hypothetical protein